jgi:hypothetical protein
VAGPQHECRAITVILACQLLSEWAGAPFYSSVRSWRVASSPQTGRRTASRRALQRGQPACAGQEPCRHGLGERLCMRR